MTKSPNIPKKYICELCDYTTSNKTDFVKHNLTRKHIMTQNDTINPKNPLTHTKTFVCELCEYNTTKKTDFIKHKLTKKHIINVNEQINYKTESFLCNCGLNFNSRTTLWRHTKKCLQKIKESDIVINEPGLTNVITSDFVIELINDNKDLNAYNTKLLKENTILIEENTNLIQVNKIMREIIINSLVPLVERRRIEQKL